MKFSKASIEALTLPEGKTEWLVWDNTLPGFGVRVRATSKAWRIQYRVGNQQRSESLGDIRKVALEDARKIARQRFAKIELGIDPGAEKAALRRGQETLGSLATEYLADKQSRLRKESYRASSRYLEQHWAPLRQRPLSSITLADVAQQLRVITKENGVQAASKARRTLSAFFVWCMKNGKYDANPVMLTDDPAKGAGSRERVLSDPEIKVIWNACLNDDFGRIVRLLLLTGCRREEIGQLRWSELETATGLLTIPGTRTKNGRELRLPLSSISLDILKSQEPRRDGLEYVFGQWGAKGGFYGWSYATAALRKRIAEQHGKLPEWRLHDLRRTMRTGLGRLGIAPHIAELCINHAVTGVQAVYDKHSYEPDIKAALQAWADHVSGVV